MDKISPLPLRERYSKHLLEEVKQKYPRIQQVIAAKRLQKKHCPRCARKLHKTIEGQIGYYYCVCTPELLVLP